MKTTLTSLSLASLLGLSAGCTQEVDDVTTVQSALTVSFVLPLPVGLNATDVAMAASGQLFVNDRAQVREQANSTDFAMVSNVGTATGSTTNIGVSSRTATIISRPRVTLRNNSVVSGSLYQGADVVPETQGPFTVSGFTQFPVNLETDTTWTRDVTWPSTVGGAVSLEPGQPPTVFPLSPGAYRAVSVKSGRTLRLTAGSYFFDSLNVESQAGLQVDGSLGPVFIFLNGPFTFRGNMTGSVASPGMPIASLTVMTNNAATIVSSSFAGGFDGVVIAPTGAINLMGGVYRGAFFGRSVTIFEDGRVLHVRDPFSFAAFGRIDRASVTGGSIRLGDQVTDEFIQSEAVTAISRDGAGFVVTVGYNDKTTGISNPDITYPAGRSGDKDDIKRGVSLMGWSFSTDGGFTFNYGGRVKPPAGWSAIWSDPALAKVSIDDPFVYYAQVASSDAGFSSFPFNQQTQAGYDAATDTLKNIAPPPDSHCIARSMDRGKTFPDVACVKEIHNLADATTLAAGLNPSGAREVFLSSLAGIPLRVWRMNGDTMQFIEELEVPLPSGTDACNKAHPRIRVASGSLYVMCATSIGRLVGNTFDLTTRNWRGAQVLATGLTETLGVGIRFTTSFSFDIGRVGTTSFGQPINKVRVIYDVDDGAMGMNLVTRECNLDLSGCSAEIPEWSTRNLFGSEVAPSLRFGGGSWTVAWMEAALGAVGPAVARLETLGTTRRMNTIFPNPTAVPCFQLGFGYWGDYNEIDSFGDGRFFVPYTVNGPGCRFQGKFLADHHVGGSVVAF
jgi:hypothetical protein